MLSEITLRDFKFNTESISIKFEEYKKLFRKQRWKIEKCPDCRAKISEIEQRFCESCGKKL